VTDWIDDSVAKQEKELEARIQAARGQIPPGSEGECDLCGEWSGRLVNGACSPCRDKYELG